MLMSVRSPVASILRMLSAVHAARRGILSLRPFFAALVAAVLMPVGAGGHRARSAGAGRSAEPNAGARHDAGNCRFAGGGVGQPGRRGYTCGDDTVIVELRGVDGRRRSAHATVRHGRAQRTAPAELLEALAASVRARERPSVETGVHSAEACFRPASWSGPWRVAPVSSCSSRWSCGTWW
jgi:hypothetical protein